MYYTFEDRPEGNTLMSRILMRTTREESRQKSASPIPVRGKGRREGGRKNLVNEVKRKKCV